MYKKHLQDLPLSTEKTTQPDELRDESDAAKHAAALARTFPHFLR
jgi:hypothetical protein